jgi:2',3'-cyclic-nucleotide 2'-phosphodiesterase (5'-nucleotidase family)
MRILLLLLLMQSWAACKSPDSTSAVAGSEPDLPLQDSLRSRLSGLGMTTPCPEGKLCATFLQINDVYEVDAVAGGAVGGLDRIAALRRMLAEKPEAGPVVVTLAGDFLNPSGLGMLKENGKSWAGRQMVSVLKAAGLDLAVFGNHEFDLNLADLQARLDESGTPSNPDLDACQGADARAAGLSLTGSRPVMPDVHDEVFWTRAEAFEEATARGKAPGAVASGDIRQPTGGAALHGGDDTCAPTVISARREAPACFQWVASNVTRRSNPGSAANPTSDRTADQAWTSAGRPIPKALVLHLGDNERALRVGIVGLTILKNQKDYQQFTEVAPAARQLIAALRAGADGQPAVDAVVAITHINRADDIALLEDEPGIDLSIGGHDHKHSFDCVGEGQRRCVAKADANARTAYLHRLVFDPAATDRAQRLSIRSELIAIDESIPRDPKVSALIQCFFRRADAAAAVAISGGKSTPLKAMIAKVAPRPLDGTEDGVRQARGSNLTELYARAMLDTAREAATDGQAYQLAVVNGGSFRIDDLVGPGAVSYYDAVRILPFGGKLLPASIRIADLAAILYRSWVELPPGSGAVLHLHPRLTLVDRPRQEISAARIEEELRQIAGAADANATIRVVSTEYLLKFGDDLTKEAQAKFTVRTDPLRQTEMRELLVETLGASYPP